MRFLAIVLLGLVASTVVLAQSPSVEDDAEVVGADEGAKDDQDGVFFYFPGFGDIRTFFKTLLGRRRGGGEGEIEGEIGSTPEEASARGIFSSLFGGSAFDPFFTVFRPKNYTVTFSNSSLEVVNYGRVPMVVNKTIEERKGEDGSLYYSVVQTLVGPYDNSTDLNVTSSVDLDSDGATPSYEESEVEEEPSTRLRHTLTKRWIVSWLKNKLAKRENTETHATTNNHMPGTTNEEAENTNRLDKEDEMARENSNINMNTEHLEKEEKEREEERATGNGLSYIGDTDVNFLDPRRVLNPDAEVFDQGLVRDAENEIFERRYGRPKPLAIRSQPIRRLPLTAQPLAHPPTPSQPLGTRPHRSYSIRSEPLRSQPIRFEPLHSQPLASRPLRERYVRL